MTGFDVIEEFPAAMAGREGAWRFIRGFAAAWRTPLVECDGWSEADLDAAEARLGLRLPAALREAYQLFGRRDDLTSVQDHWLTPERLRIDDQALVFRIENQSVCSWGILLSELGQPDPPVVIGRSSEYAVIQTWESWLDRFSHACLEIMLTETVLSDEDLGDIREFDESEATSLEQGYARLPLPTYFLVPEGEYPGTRWFAGQDVIVRDDGSEIWVRARTEEALDRIRAELPGDWQMD